MKDTVVVWATIPSEFTLVAIKQQLYYHREVNNVKLESVLTKKKGQTTLECKKQLKDELLRVLQSTAVKDH